MSKKIGIVGWVDEHMFGVNKAYLEFIERFGTPIILTPSTEARDDLDLLILPGGPDINPDSYQTGEQKPSYYTSKLCPFRDYFDEVHLPFYMNQLHTPIFGICRGFQTLAVMLGCGFDPHISSFHPKTDKNRRYERVHGLKLSPRMLQLFGDNYMEYVDAEDVTKYKHKVNSMHHQGVTEAPKNLSLATAGTHNVYHEVIMSTDCKIAGVQYHPEELEYDPIAETLINKLLSNEA